MEQIDIRNCDERRAQCSTTNENCNHSKYNTLEEIYSGNPTGKYVCSNCYQYHQDKYYVLFSPDKPTNQCSVFICNNWDYILEKSSDNVSDYSVEILVNPKTFKEKYEWKGIYLKATIKEPGHDSYFYNLFLKRVEIKKI